jgi:hypothetical protein
VGAVLDRFNLAYMLEAHCYLTFEKHRIDVTRDLAAPGVPIARLLYEERITPDQIGAYKRRVHQQALGEWIITSPDECRGFGADELWGIREACIAALGQ